ncbi:MAG: D-inositol-3-phosphate glycosyltransferase [Candidatus Dormibacteria bacterium]
MQQGDALRGSGRAIAVVSVHASPLGDLGSGENGGMNLAVRRLCEELSRLGVPSDVFTRRDHAGGPDEELIAPMSRLVRLPAGVAAQLPKEQVAATLPAFARALREHAVSERRSYRLVHSHYWLSGRVAEAVRRPLGLHWLHSSHTLARTKAAAGLPLDRARADAEAILVRRADRLLASSLAERQDLIRLYGAAADRVCVVPLGVDPHAVDDTTVAALRARPEAAGRRTILYAGRLERLKGLDLLVDALAVLAADGRHDDVVVLVAGADSGDGASQSGHPGGETGRLLARARSLGVADHLHFLGPVAHAELAAHFAAADVVAVPSRTETFGLTALEALATGTPVVATAAGGLSELIDHRVDGLLVAGRDPAVFAAHLAAVLDDPRLAHQLGEAGRIRAERYSWERAGTRLARIFDGVESPPPRGQSLCGEPATAEPAARAERRPALASGLSASRSGMAPA